MLKEESKEKENGDSENPAETGRLCRLWKASVLVSNSEVRFSLPSDQSFHCIGLILGHWMPGSGEWVTGFQS